MYVAFVPLFPVCFGVQVGSIILVLTGVSVPVGIGEANPVSITAELTTTPIPSQASPYQP